MCQSGKCIVSSNVRGESDEDYYRGDRFSKERVQRAMAWMNCPTVRTRRSIYKLPISLSTLDARDAQQVAALPIPDRLEVRYVSLQRPHFWKKG